MTVAERHALTREIIEQCAKAVRETPVQFVRGRIDGAATLTQAEDRVRRLLTGKEWYE